MRSAANSSQGALMVATLCGLMVGSCMCSSSTTGTNPDSGPIDAGAADGGANDGGRDGGPGEDSGTQSDSGLSGIQKIQHIVVIMQENRSFDEYFGTFPGVNGIVLPDGGISPVCLPANGTGPGP